MGRKNFKHWKKNKYGKYHKRKIFDWQFLDPADDVVKTLTRPRSSFHYLPEYILKCEGSVGCGTGNLLVEWFHHEDRYVVQAINVPIHRVSRGLLRKSAPINDHYINPRKQMLLLFEVYRDTRGVRARVRHVPTFVEFRSWTNIKLPKLQVVRKGHDHELSTFLGNDIIDEKSDDQNPFNNVLLDRIEKKI